MKEVTPFLMFQDGNAEQAMKFYTSLTEDAEIISMIRYEENEGEQEGKIKQGLFSIKGQKFMCLDSPPVHQFDFTPSFSIFVTCDTEEELQDLYEKLLEGGQALMPLDTYDFSKKFAWINDQFGISWQLNLP